MREFFTSNLLCPTSNVTEPSPIGFGQAGSGTSWAAAEWHSGRVSLCLQHIRWCWLYLTDHRAKAGPIKRGKMPTEKKRRDSIWTQPKDRDLDIHQIAVVKIVSRCSFCSNETSWITFMAFSEQTSELWVPTFHLSILAGGRASPPLLGHAAFWKINFN